VPSGGSLTADMRLTRGPTSALPRVSRPGVVSGRRRHHASGGEGIPGAVSTPATWHAQAVSARPQATAHRSTAPAAGAPVVTARLLGDFAVAVGPCPVSGWPRPPARRLVQLLLVTPGHRVSRADAIGALAPGSPHDQARRAVSKALSQARRALGENLIVAEGVHLRLAATVSTDLEEVREGLRAALRMPAGAGRLLELERTLARVGPILPGEPDVGALASARRELDGLARIARVALAEASEPGSLDAWESAFAADPSDEEVAIGLVSACRRLGQESRALHVYRACRAALRAAGSLPTPALDAAVEGLLAPGAERHGPGRLRGRDRELRLLATLRDAEDHAGTAVLVTGRAGVGKSALVSAASDHLQERGWHIAFAAAGADDDLVPYAALRGALSELIERSDGGTSPLPASVRSLLRPGRRPIPSRVAMPVLVADLGRFLDRFAIAQPVLVVIDDVHRSDPATHQLLGMLATMRPARSWSLLMAARTDEPGRPVPTLPAGVQRIALAPLDPASAQALARERLAAARVPEVRHEELAELIAGWSAGNPLFIEELVLQAASDASMSRRHLRVIPDRIVELLEQRLVRCSDAARAVLPLVALAQPHSDYALVAELAASLGLDRDGAETVIDELLEAAVVVRGDTGLRLAHPLWREAALSRVNPLRLASLHTRIAEATERVGGRELVAAGHRIAAFRAAPLAEHAESAARCGIHAGRAARSLLADETALQLFGPALAAFEAMPADRRRLLRSGAFRSWLEVGHVHSDRLDLGEATAAYERALGLAAGDDEYAAAYSALGALAYKRGDFAGAEEIYARGRGVLRGGSAWAEARIEADLAWACQRQGKVRRSLDGLSKAVGLFGSTKDRASTASCLDLLAVALASAGRLEEALETSDRALAVAARCRDRHIVPTLAAHRARLLLSASRPSAAESEARRGVDAARRAGDRYVESVALWVLADCLDALGNLEGALTNLHEEEAILLELQNDVNRARCLAHQAILQYRLGRAAEAQRSARAARRAAGATGQAHVLASVEAMLAAAGTDAS
jgi:DNA-binding SARP family transcriptional activator/tetratricopeptide (TPR) repeat protein